MISFQFKIVLMLFGIFLLLSCQDRGSSAQVRTSLENWIEIKLSNFSFYVPPGLVPEEAVGKDSAIWKYASKDLVLTIDLGRYSGIPVANKHELDYAEKIVKIGGKKATVVSFKYREPVSQDLQYVTAAYFSKVNAGGTKLSFVAHCRTPEAQEVAKKIFSTIRFNKLPQK